MKKKQVANLQALRGFAALCVVLSHILATHNQPIVGLFGVDIFFVLSGYVISLVASGERRTFVRRRLIRIVPLYWVLTLLVFAAVVAWPEIFHFTTADPVHLACSLSFLPCRDQAPILPFGWTLNYEMYFYACCAIAIATTRRFAPAVACMILGAVTLLSSINPVLPSFYANPIIVEFMFGVAVYYVIDFCPKVPSRLLKYIALSALLAVILVELVVPITVANRPLTFGVPSLIIVTALILLEADQHRIENRAILLVGDASYGLYLIHPIILGAVLRLSRLSEGAQIFIGFFSSAAIALTLHFLVDIPMRRRLTKWLLPRSSAVPSGNLPSGR